MKPNVVIAGVLYILSAPLATASDTNNASTPEANDLVLEQILTELKQTNKHLAAVNQNLGTLIIDQRSKLNDNLNELVNIREQISSDNKEKLIDILEEISRKGK